MKTTMITVSFPYTLVVQRFLNVRRRKVMKGSLDRASASA
jgi:hypothetical protein